ncbi:putative RNA-directed DNA polymerase from transposon BS [Trichonephila clavipes]|nr:putative RNA-directed DNA polymerase from transposon BS [Trichonephila clavipes]
MFENLGHRGKLRLLDIINLSWKIGRLPAEWKRAIIIPINKAGKNNWSPKDFRPIALTSTTCKIMEKNDINQNSVLFGQQELNSW